MYYFKFKMDVLLFSGIKCRAALRWCSGEQGGCGLNSNLTCSPSVWLLSVLQLPLTVHVGLTGSSKLSAGLSASVGVLDLLVQIVIPPST